MNCHVLDIIIWQVRRVAHYQVKLAGKGRRRIAARKHSARPVLAVLKSLKADVRAGDILKVLFKHMKQDAGAYSDFKGALAAVLHNAVGQQESIVRWDVHFASTLPFSPSHLRPAGLF